MAYRNKGPPKVFGMGPTKSLIRPWGRGLYLMGQVGCRSTKVTRVQLCLCACTGVSGNPDEDDLFTKLFYTRYYNRLTRPVFNLSQTTHIQLGLVLQKIVQVVCSSNYVAATSEKQIS